MISHVLIIRNDAFSIGLHHEKLVDWLLDFLGMFGIHNFSLGFYKEVQKFVGMVLM